MPSEEEGFPHTLLEAMATPVSSIVFNVGAIKSIMSQKCQKDVINLGDVNGFVKRINFYIENKKELKKAALAQFEKVKEYDLEKVKNDFIKIIYDKQISKY